MADRERAAAARGGRGTDHRGYYRRPPRGARRAAGCVPRVRAAPGGSTDGGTRALDRGGRSARVDARGAGAQRDALPPDAALQVRARPLERRHHLRARHRPVARPTVRRRAAGATLGDAPRGGAAAGAPLATLLHEPCAEDRRLIEDALADGADDARAVDGAATPDGRGGRGERRDLGAARPAAPGARGPGAAQGERRYARPGDARRRRGGGHPGRRVHRPPEPALRRCPALGRAHGGRPRPRAGRLPQRRAAHPGRCGAGDRGEPAAHWRRDHQRRPRSPAHRREAAVGEHARRDGGRGRGAGRAPAGATGRGCRSDDLPPGDVHRDVAPQPEPGAPHRLRARHRRARLLPPRLADGRHQPHGNSALASRRGGGDALPRRDDRHDGTGRPRHRAGRGGGRCHHRRREHRPPPAAEPRGGSPRSAFNVVLDASLEVRSAVVYASLIVALVFLPVFFLGGLAGSFFRPSPRRT